MPASCLAIGHGTPAPGSHRPRGWSAGHNLEESGRFRLAAEADAALDFGAAGRDPPYIHVEMEDIEVRELLPVVTGRCLPPMPAVSQEQGLGPRSSGSLTHGAGGDNAWW